MNGNSTSTYKDAPETVTHPAVHARFLELLDRDQDTGLSAPWKKALLEPPNPLPPKKRSALKLPALLGLSIAGTGIAVFLWFSFLH